MQNHGNNPALQPMTIGMLLAASLIVGSTLSSCADASPQPPATSAEATCPESIEAKSAVPQPGEGGDLVPSGAGDAVLCTYSDVEDSPASPLLSAKHAEDPTAAVRALNSLPGHDVQTVCTLMGGPLHQVILTYAYRPSVTVVLDYSCATAHSAGISRRLVSQKILFAPFSD